MSFSHNESFNEYLEITLFWRYCGFFSYVGVEENSYSSQPRGLWALMYHSRAPLYANECAEAFWTCETQLDSSLCTYLVFEGHGTMCRCSFTYFYPHMKIHRYGKTPLLSRSRIIFVISLWLYLSVCSRWRNNSKSDCGRSDHMLSRDVVQMENCSFSMV